MTALVLATALIAASPTYLVERIVVDDAGVRRVSVFRDGTAVLAVRGRDGEPHVTRRGLDPLVLRSLRQVVDETYTSLKEFAGFEGVPGEATVEIRLAPAGRDALIVRLPVTSVPSVAGSRLMRAIDDVDEALSSYEPGHDDLSRWQPQVGERVVLADGVVVTVLAVLSEGRVIQVEVGEGPALVFYDVDELRTRAVRLVSP